MRPEIKLPNLFEFLDFIKDKDLEGLQNRVWELFDTLYEYNCQLVITLNAVSNAVGGDIRWKVNPLFGKSEFRKHVDLILKYASGIGVETLVTAFNDWISDVEKMEVIYDSVFPLFSTTFAKFGR